MGTQDALRHILPQGCERYHKKCQCDKCRIAERAAIELQTDFIKSGGEGSGVGKKLKLTPLGGDLNTPREKKDPPKEEEHVHSNRPLFQPHTGPPNPREWPSWLKNAKTLVEREGKGQAPRDAGLGTEKVSVRALLHLFRDMAGYAEYNRVNANGTRAPKVFGAGWLLFVPDDMGRLTVMITATQSLTGWIPNDIALGVDLTTGGGTLEASFHGVGELTFIPGEPAMQRALTPDRYMRVGGHLSTYVVGRVLHLQIRLGKELVPIHKA